MQLQLYRCLKPESVHFYELCNLVDHESEYYYFLQFADGTIEEITRDEVTPINYIETHNNKSYDPVDEEQQSFIDLYKEIK